MPKLKVREVKNMKSGIGAFGTTIFNNFVHLSDVPELQHSRSEIIRLLSSANMLSYVLYNNSNMMLGYLVGEKKHLNDGRIVFYVSYMYIGKKYRSKKLGSYLMNLIIDKCRETGIKFITLTCDTKNKKVMSFYEKMKFVQDPLLRNFKRHDIFTLYL